MGLSTVIDITPDQRTTILALLERYLPNTTVWVYGSRAKWTARPQSDLDMVVFATSEQNRKVFDLREAFEESSLPFRVDLFVWDSVPEQFRKRIEVEHVVLMEKEEQNIVSNWHKTTLGDLLSFSNGKSSPERSDDLPHPVYGSNGIIGFSDKTNADPNTIIVGRVGTYCGSLQYSSRMCWVTDNAIRANATSGNNAKFIFYLLQTLQLNDWQTGSGQPLLNQSILSSIPVTVPDPTEQRAIAHILGTLDDKIELNRRMNETLEEMARALFKSWFVDFDPVRAKMEGRDPGLPKHLADLFPNRLVDSELGPIPEGWKVKALVELIELAYGKALKVDNRKDGIIPVYGSNGQVGWHDERLVAGPGIVVGRKGNPGVVTWTQSDFFPIDTTFYVVPIQDSKSLPFLYFALTTQNLPSIAADSAVPGLNRNLAYMNRQLVPDKMVMDEFINYANIIFARRHGLEEESRTLAAQRDALLPQLISGELRVESV